MTKEPIYSRIKAAIDAGPCERVYLGSHEWAELCELCKKWGHDWPPGGEDYNPEMIEQMRGEFLKKKIYRVDSEDHLQTL